MFVGQSWDAVGISLQSALTSGDSMGPYDPKPLDDIQLWCTKLPTVNGSVNAWCSFFSLIEWSFGSVTVDFARLVSHIQASVFVAPSVRAIVMHTHTHIKQN